MANAIALLGSSEFVIDDATDLAPHVDPVIDGERKGRGGVPRDYAVQPKEMFDPPSGMKLVPRDQWAERCKEQAANKSRNSDILLKAGIPSMDQDGVGYCWAHSVTGAVQGTRAVANQPYVPLSAFCVAATIKTGRDEGGWCGLSAEFARTKGIMPQSVWPQQDRNYKKYDTPANWAEAAKYKIEENFIDLLRDVYEQNLTFDQVATCAFNNEMMAVDFNWWSHSIMGCDVVDLSAQVVRGANGKKASLKFRTKVMDMTAGFGLRIRNSWTDTYGEKGFAVLSGTKCIPDGAIAIRTATAA